MAEIHINYDLPALNIKGIEEPHKSNIQKFKDILNDVLKDVDGKFLFDYNNKYKQFEPLDGPVDLTAQQVAEINRRYPSCFI